MSRASPMGISLLAAGSPIYAVFLSFCFYALNLLVPIIPAVIIYRLFPGGKRGGPDSTGDSVEGSVGGWKIKAVGAWAAYVTAFVLGFWTIQSTAVPLIKAVGGASVWTFDSDFRFENENGQEIRDASLTNLEVEPPMVVPWGRHATIRLFSDSLDPPESIRIKMQGYEPTVVPLPAEAHDGKIRLSSVTLKRLPPLAASGPTPAPLPSFAGPPIVTSTQPRLTLTQPIVTSTQPTVTPTQPTVTSTP
jgi:hypothetical protein